MRYLLLGYRLRRQNHIDLFEVRRGRIGVRLHILLVQSCANGVLVLDWLSIFSHIQISDSN